MSIGEFIYFGQMLESLHIIYNNFIIITKIKENNLYTDKLNIYYEFIHMPIDNYILQYLYVCIFTKTCQCFKYKYIIWNINFFKI